METEIKEEIKVEKVKVKKPGEIIFIPMWMKALPICDNEYTSNIAKKINVTYSHLLFLLDAFKEASNALLYLASSEYLAILVS